MPLTPGGWSTVYADPPWRFTNRTGKVAPEHRRLDRYDTMTQEEICALPVQDVVADNAHLYLWVPNALLPQGLEVMQSWGFRYVSNLVWAKRRKDGGPDGRGVGFYFRNVTEIILFGVRGSMRTLAAGRPDLPGYRNVLSAHKDTLKWLARRPLEPHDEIADLDAMIAAIVDELAPNLVARNSIGHTSAAQLILTAGDNSERLRSEASFAALCGVSPVPASSGKTTRHRLNRGGDRAANSALHIIAIGRLRSDPRTQAYVAKRIAEGHSKLEAIRCVKRYIAREVFSLISNADRRSTRETPPLDKQKGIRRAETLEVPRPRRGGEPMHLLVDSTGLTLCGPGEWLAERHGTKRRRGWKKLHLATGADTGHIVASVLTDKDADDGSQVGPLLDRIDVAVASFTGDGAFDRDDVYAAVAARHPDAAVIVPPRVGAVPSGTAETAPTQRDRHLKAIAERGRMGWQGASGYHWRALGESDVSRWKRVIGDGLRLQTDGRQATEVAIAANVLNRMLELGRPEYVRTT